MIYLQGVNELRSYLVDLRFVRKPSPAHYVVEYLPLSNGIDREVMNETPSNICSFRS